MHPPGAVKPALIYNHNPGSQMPALWSNDFPLGPHKRTLNGISRTGQWYGCGCKKNLILALGLSLVLLPLARQCLPWHRQRSKPKPPKSSPLPTFRIRLRSLPMVRLWFSLSSLDSAGPQVVGVHVVRDTLRPESRPHPQYHPRSFSPASLPREGNRHLP